MSHAAATVSPDFLAARTMRAPEPAALDTATAARYIGLGRTRLFEEISAGRIPARKSGNRTLILRADLDAWLANLPIRTV